MLPCPSVAWTSGKLEPRSIACDMGVQQPVRGYRYIGSGKRATRALLIRLRHYLPTSSPIPSCRCGATALYDVHHRVLAESKIAGDKPVGQPLGM